MAQIQATPGIYDMEIIKLYTDEADLDLSTARKMAKKKARDLDSSAMLLSYHSEKTGDFWPKIDCGGGDKPPWIVFAEARGYNLTVDIDDGDFLFFYLRP